jgi:hypothetical protein
MPCMQDAVDDDDAAAAPLEEDWMARTAALARAAPGPTLGLLVELLRGAKATLFQCMSQGDTQSTDDRSDTGAAGGRSGATTC